MLDNTPPPRRLVLPPPYTAHWLPKGDAFAEARKRAPEDGAGTLVWHHSSSGEAPGRFDFAVVLEPGMPLAEARKAVLIGMVALADAVAAHCPPERDVRFGWPTELVLDAGRLGGMRLAVAPQTGEAEEPAWMVLGVELIADRNHLDQSGAYPGSVSLAEEDFEDPAAILESFAAHLMLNFDRWTHGGFASVAAMYAGRLNDDGAIGEAGELIRGGQSEPIAQGLENADWRDAEGPRL
ncbi:biotin/lipoate--protein ligase family protein [Aestuariivita sp.]|uniref:biotin/lipoate--protein ligase family protein n=1 Tax=Aestuariivita sp. TaxID=1872407 RepID=UPI002171B283|nr:biotin/lipoate--protein ligase family protein [Aestuariivita sp.]MCE8008468.1 hypothetical protein [Aestuariivita sp.]